MSPVAPVLPCGPAAPCAPCGPCEPAPVAPCAPCAPWAPCGPSSPCGPCGPVPPPAGPCGPCGPCGPVLPFFFFSDLTPPLPLFLFLPFFLASASSVPVAPRAASAAAPMAPSRRTALRRSDAEAKSFTDWSNCSRALSLVITLSSGASVWSSTRPELTGCWSSGTIPSPWVGNRASLAWWNTILPSRRHGIPTSLLPNGGGDLDGMCAPSWRMRCKHKKRGALDTTFSQSCLINEGAIPTAELYRD